MVVLFGMREAIGWLGLQGRSGLLVALRQSYGGLRDGLTLCNNLNISAFMLKLDAKAIVDVVHNVNYENNILSPTLDDCRRLMSRVDQVHINHVYRQAN